MRGEIGPFDQSAMLETGCTGALPTMRVEVYHAARKCDAQAWAASACPCSLAMSVIARGLGPVVAI